MKLTTRFLSFLSLVVFTAVALQAQSFTIQPTALTIAQGGSGQITLESTVGEPQEWKVVQPVSPSIAVAPMQGALPGHAHEAVTIKALGKPGERVGLTFTNGKEKVGVRVTIGKPGSDGVVTGGWSLSPMEGVFSGKPVQVIVKNSTNKPLNFTVGRIPKTINVAPMSGNVPPMGEFPVNIDVKIEGSVSSTPILIPFNALKETKNFKLTIKPPPPPPNPTDIKPR